MDLLDRGAKLANVIAILPAGYCAYGTWVVLHPHTYTPINPAQQAAHLEAPMFSVAGLVASVTLFPLCVALGAVFNIMSSKERLLSQKCN